jgi:hypothetical protein
MWAFRLASRRSGRPTFEVLVGADQQSFEVDYGIMTKYSKFFRAARSRRWTSKTKPTELPEQDPSIFALYLDFLYDRTMPKTPSMARPLRGVTDDYLSDDMIPRDHDLEVEDANKVLIDAYWEKLIGLYVLACYLLDPTTRNMTIDQIRRFYYEVGKYDYSLKEEVISLVLRSTPDGDPLRNLFADFFVYGGEVTHTDLPKE